MSDDPFDLQRFIDAQAGIYSRVRTELAAGEKASHWMWFIFPQLAALGRSATAKRYGIGSLDEARAYLAHPVLGARLKECAALLLAVQGRTAHEIMGSPDDLKLRSSMTLFAQAGPDSPEFAQMLRKFFDGLGDELTLELLSR
jgi:uncharacterized protein (DUF1810 family)